MLVPEDKDESIMIRQQGAQPGRVIGSPANSDHQAGNNDRGNPAEAEQADLGTYQTLQHNGSGWSGNKRPRRVE
jgi:hypothetical protein